MLPTLAYGFAALMFFSLLGFRPSIPLLVIGHAVVIAPFVFRTTMASLSQLDPSLLESSASLGAGRFTTFRRITLPLIAPGIAAGAFLAFIASIDNVPVSLFLSNARTDMLPIRMWGMMEIDARRARRRRLRRADRQRGRADGGDGAPRRPVAAHVAGVGAGLKLILRAAGRRAVCSLRRRAGACRIRSGRTYFDGALGNLRPAARPSLSLARREELSSLPLTATQMERHEFSSQSFVPLEAGRWLVIVAPHAAGGGPDMANAPRLPGRPATRASPTA